MLRPRDSPPGFTIHRFLVPLRDVCGCISLSSLSRFEQSKAIESQRTSSCFLEGSWVCFLNYGSFCNALPYQSSFWINLRYAAEMFFGLRMRNERSSYNSFPVVLLSAMIPFFLSSFESRFLTRFRMTLQQMTSFSFRKPSSSML